MVALFEFNAQPLVAAERKEEKNKTIFYIFSLSCLGGRERFHFGLVVAIPTIERESKKMKMRERGKRLLNERERECV